MTTSLAPQTPPATLRDDVEAAALTLAPWAVAALVLGLTAAGGLLYVILNPAALPALSAAASKLFWYASRSSAFVSYALVWLSMVLGLAITNRLARAWPGGPTYAALHEHASLLGLAVGAFHALILLGDQSFGYTLEQILVPFASPYRTVALGLGQWALYLLLPVTFTFYVRRWIGQSLWRWIHALSYLAFGLVLAHSVFSGTDTAAPLALAFYGVTALAVLALTAYRVARLAGRPAAN